MHTWPFRRWAALSRPSRASETSSASGGASWRASTASCSPLSYSARLILPRSRPARRFAPLLINSEGFNQSLRITSFVTSHECCVHCTRRAASSLSLCSTASAPASRCWARRCSRRSASPGATACASSAPTCERWPVSTRRFTGASAGSSSRPRCSQFVPSVHSAYVLNPRCTVVKSLRFSRTQFIVVWGVVCAPPIEYRSESTHYAYPAWATALGWLISVASIFFVPTVAIYKLFSFRGAGNFRQVRSNSNVTCSEFAKKSLSQSKYCTV